MNQNKGRNRGERGYHWPYQKAAPAGPPEPGLEWFDYKDGGMDSLKFFRAAERLKIHFGKKSRELAYVIEREEEFNFGDSPQPTAAEAAEMDHVHDPFGLKRLLFFQKVKRYEQQRSDYIDQKATAYLTLFECCTFRMQKKLRSLPDFEEKDGEKNLLWLWKAIKKLSLPTTNADNPHVRHAMAWARFQSLKMRPNNTIGDFFDRFIAELQILTSSGARIVGADHLPADPDLPQDALDALKKREQAQLAIMFLNKLDKTRYGRMLDELHNAWSRGCDLYPATLLAAYQIARDRRENGVYVGSKVAPRGAAALYTKNAKNKDADNKHGKKRSSNKKGNEVVQGKNKDSDKKHRCMFCKKKNHTIDNCFLLREAKKFLMEQEDTDDSTAAVVTASDTRVHFFNNE